MALETEADAAADRVAMTLDGALVREWYWGQSALVSALRTTWPRIVAEVKRSTDLAGVFLAHAEPVDLDGDTFILRFPGDGTFGAKKCQDAESQIRAAIQTVLGFSAGVSCQCEPDLAHLSSRMADRTTAAPPKRGRSAQEGSL